MAESEWIPTQQQASRASAEPRGGYGCLEEGLRGKPEGGHSACSREEERGGDEVESRPGSVKTLLSDAIHSPAPPHVTICFL